MTRCTCFVCAEYTLSFVDLLSDCEGTLSWSSRDPYNFLFQGRHVRVVGRLASHTNNTSTFTASIVSRFPSISPIPVTLVGLRGNKSECTSSISLHSAGPSWWSLLYNKFVICFTASSVNLNPATYTANGDAAATLSFLCILAIPLRPSLPSILAGTTFGVGVPRAGLRVRGLYGSFRSLVST